MLDARAEGVSRIDQRVLNRNRGQLVAIVDRVWLFCAPIGSLEDIASLGGLALLSPLIEGVFVLDTQLALDMTAVWL